MTDDILDTVFLSYKKILYRLNLQDIKTKTGKKITYKDLVYAINVMDKKHICCRWKFKRYRRRREYVLIEGYYWLVNVYFNNKKSLINADIDFFNKRIKQYEDLLEVKPKKLWNEEMSVKSLPEYFDRKPDTIRKAISKMKQSKGDKFIYKKDNETIITKEGLEWLCKNCFKTKYLELLEDYKMELTQKYIDAGYIYDYFLAI